MPPDHPFDHVVRLPRDDDATAVSQPTAHGTLHWAPHHDHGYSARMQALARWVGEARPQACVVDVSVEVAVFLRLLGIPVVVVALPGDRRDPAHVLVHQLADHILAAWPAALNTPAWLTPHAGKTSYVGGISRFEDRQRPDGPDGRDCGLRVLVLAGAEGDVRRDVPAPQEGITWQTLGGGSGNWVDDPWPALCAADVVVSHAGQNSIADIAAARRPAVVVPQPRPFDEQISTAQVLSRHGLAARMSGWPTDTRWPVVLQRAMTSDPTQWKRWQTDGAAARAAAAIEATARSCRPAA